MADLPSQLTIEDLQRTHPDYDAQCIESHEDLYEGGERFKKRIDRYLDKRQVEMSAGQGAYFNPKSEGDPYKSGRDIVEATDEGGGGGNIGAQQWELRKRISRYTPLAAGIVDYFTAGVFYSEAEIFSDPKDEYYSSLNENADGKGTPLNAVLRPGLRDSMVHCGPFLSITSPKTTATNRADQRKNKELDCRLGIVPTASVNDWDITNGEYDFIRTHRMDLARSQPFGAIDKEVHTWTYVSATQIAEFTKSWLIKDGPPKDTETVTGDVRTHALGALPLIPMFMPKDLWLMKRLYEPILKFYNRDASITWFLNQLGYPFLHGTTESGTAPPKVISELSMSLGRTGDTMMYVSPPPGSFEPLMKDREDCRANFYETMQAMGAHALASQAQNARQSGDAKEMDKEPLGILLRMFSYSVRGALQRALSVIKAYREDSHAITIHGLDRFDVRSLQAKIDAAISTSEIPDFPFAARKEQLKEVALSVCASASQEVKNEIVEEVKKMKEPAPPVENGAKTPPEKLLEKTETFTAA